MLKQISSLAALLALLWVFTPSGEAATTKKAPAKKATATKKAVPKKAAPKKTATKAVAKKAAPAKKAVATKSAAKKPAVKQVATKKPVAKKAAPKKARPVLATRPPADLPSINEATSAWQGCLNPIDIPELATQLGIETNRLTTAVHEAGLPESSCTPYVAVIGGVDDSSLVMFQPQETLPALMVHKDAGELTVNTGQCDCSRSTNRVVTMSIPATEEISQLPPQIQWIAGILVPPMITAIDIQTRTNYNLRMVISEPTDLGPERLRSIELLETATGKRVDGAWWLDRPNGPGVMIGMKGIAYEQLLWQSPVAYERSARGVGPRIVTVKSKTKKGTVTTRKVSTSKPLHYGVDMTAAKGTDVHAVADATVSFAGRRGTFGNLVILDHGLGYQTYYAHLSKILPDVKEGASIPRGELIGLVGSTGHSTAPHLHFEVRQDNNYIDPFDESHQLGFWQLDADDQERLALEMLAPTLEPVLTAAEE